MSHEMYALTALVVGRPSPRQLVVKARKTVHGPGDGEAREFRIDSVAQISSDR